MTPKAGTGPAAPGLPPPETIISGSTGQPVSFDAMLADLRTVQVVYVGEKHTSAEHHAVQLRVIQALHVQGPPPAVAMEMFDRSYQAVLERWSAGEMDEESFLRRTHWYANWRFDYGLYRNILAYVRDHRLRMAALNLPFSIPPKIRVGGRRAFDRILTAVEQTVRSKPKLSFIATILVDRVAHEAALWIQEGKLTSVYNLTQIAESEAKRDAFHADLAAFLGCEK